MPPLPSRREQLLLSVSRFPENPGVYLMKDAAGEPIYIGKAVNLRARVRSYFSDAHETRAQIPIMLTQLETVDWIATNTESEALILEANLIRRHRPRYNIDLRDDKHFPYIKVTVQEPFPRLRIVRRVLQDGARYFGPYTDAFAMRRLAAFAKRIFQLADCSMVLPPARALRRPCINFSMRRCSGACAGRISQEAYRARIDDLLKFLSGRRNSLLSDLESRMQAASRELRFEEAALLRDQTKLIRDAARLQQVDLKIPGVNCDVFGFAASDRVCCMAVLHFRDGLLMSTDHFLLPRALWDLGAGHDRDAVLLQYYLDNHREVPSELVISGDNGFTPSAIEAWFTTVRGERVAITVPRKGVRLQLVAMAVKNARLYIIQNNAPSGADDCAELQKTLGLENLPRVIEAFDISNLGESFCVAGMVRFKNGMPDKSGYRRYKIKTVQGQNDAAMMTEVVTRRLARLQKENAPFPDLLLIDGGTPQLHAAMQAFAVLEGIDGGASKNPPEIIALAKKEELVFSPSHADPVRLPAAHPARKLLERIRNEVHRYSVGFHRAVRGRQFAGSSQLEKLEGVGPVTAKLLLRTFGSVKRVAQAAPEEIAKVRGMTLAKAIKIKAGLEKPG
jgi:excinuclease ABC subunit C